MQEEIFYVNSYDAKPQFLKYGHHRIVTSYKVL